MMYDEPPQGRFHLPTTRRGRFILGYLGACLVAGLVLTLLSSR